jgi:hypothetical protein
MAKTYSLTTRNAKQPKKVSTFTLEDEYLKVNLTGALRNLRIIAIAEDHNVAEKKNLKQQLKPATMKMLESQTGPIHVGDIIFQLNGSKGGKLKITAWRRLGGLRLAPLNILQHHHHFEHIRLAQTRFNLLSNSSCQQWELLR